MPTITIRKDYPGRERTNMPAAAKKLSAIKKILRDHKALLRDQYHICRIGIFGSYVRGDTHKKSDVDVLVEFSEPISLIRLVSLENYLTGIVGVRVDVVPKDDIRRELRDSILKEAIYL
ncbi:MAG: nucleotidyltransferase family protein [Methanoregula sp.]|nr:nucleotidyltransferase family protein [Methanoregula sp.]